MGVLKILAETHRKIAGKIYDKILYEYGIELNLDKLEWGAVAPDYLPYYKFKRHYKEESINFICGEIVNLIFICRYADLYSDKNSFLIKYLSKRIGIISHYLCDYTCYPHAYRMTFIGNMKKHIKYESDLNDYAKEYNFENNHISINSINIECNSLDSLFFTVKNYINYVIDNYKSEENSFSNDLNYAMKLSYNMTDFIVETILDYSEEMGYQFA